MATLCKMQKDGYIIPPLPVAYIDAKNKAEAKQKLLRINSQYGQMSKDSVLEFASDIELNFDEIALPDNTIDFSKKEIAINGDGEVGEIETTEETLKPYNKEHILISVDIKNANKVSEIIKQLKEVEGVEIESTCN